jgi:hypothetical protein
MRAGETQAGGAAVQMLPEIISRHNKIFSRVQLIYYNITFRFIFLELLLH